MLKQSFVTTCMLKRLQRLDSIQTLCRNELIFCEIILYLGWENDQNTGNSHFKLQGEKETLRPFTSLKTTVAFNKTSK